MGSVCLGVGSRRCVKLPLRGGSRNQIQFNKKPQPRRPQTIQRDRRWLFLASLVSGSASVHGIQHAPAEL
jgi:hypothetical protein